MSKKLLIIGPCINKTKSDNTGGIIVLFENLKKVLNNKNIDYILVDSNKNNYSNKLYAYISILYNLIKKIKNTDHISMHGTINDYLYIGPYIFLLSKIFGIKFSLRKFAGNFDIFLKNTSLINKKLIIFLLKKSNCNFFETKYLVDFFKIYNKNTYWFPNVRFNSKTSTLINSNYSKRFVFMSHIRDSKGVDEILKASELLSENYTFDFYGKIVDGKYTKKYFKQYENCKYYGALRHDEILDVLKNYDVILLPSIETEGYPGIIIEGYSLGIPVITTNLRGPSEIVVNNKTGILIPPNDVSALCSAIESINKENYKQYSKNALHAFNKFDSIKCTNDYIEKIKLSIDEN